MRVRGLPRRAWWACPWRSLWITVEVWGEKGQRVQLNFAGREITIKLVYYGPALSGKTTNLKALHELTADESHGRLMTLETRDDRTLFFDMLPLVFRGETADGRTTTNPASSGGGRPASSS